MVERINKPEAPPTYRVLPSKEAKDDQSQRQEYEEGEEAYQKAVQGGDFSKYRGRSMTIKPVKVQRNRIDRVLFKSTVLHAGSAILEASVMWIDGRTTDSALFLLSRTEDYMRLKIFKKGDPVPEQFWARGPEIELGIVQMEPQSGSWGSKELGRDNKTPKKADKKSILSSIGLVDKKTGRFQWFVLALYGIAIILSIMIILHATR